MYRVGLDIFIKKGNSLIIIDNLILLCKYIVFYCKYC